MAGQNRLRDRLELRWLAMVSNIFSTSASIDQIYLLNKSDTFSVSFFSNKKLPSVIVKHVFLL